MEQGVAVRLGPPRKGWPRAAILLGAVLGLSVVRPGVLLGIPFLLLLVTAPLRSFAAVALALVAVLAVSGGDRDGVWFAERSWGVLLGGWFVAATLAFPDWRLTSRTLGAVLAATASVTVAVGLGVASWGAIDWTIADNVRGSVMTTIDGLVLLRGGEALSPALVAAVYDAAEAQVQVFPALTSLASMAALSVVWWVYTRLSGRGDQAIGPMRGFRFNDHLVWILIGGLLLLVARWGDALARVGSNAVVFMSALYAVRGAAVVMFVSGGFSAFGYLMLVLGLIFAAPVVIGAAVLVGIGDTWLDVRARASETTA